MLGKTKGFLLYGLAIFLFFLFSIQYYSFAQSEEKYISIGKSIQIKSEVLDEERNILIYLPERYNQLDRKFPVLYVLDGIGNFYHASGLLQYFDSKGLSSKLILVAITNTDRTRDFYPTKILNRPSSGGADNFLRFLKDELIPFIDKNYKTQPYRIIFGHSICGLFALYSFLTAPDLFNAYITASPPVLYDNDYIVKKGEELLEEKSILNRFLFISVGNEPSLIPSIQSFRSMLEKKDIKKLVLKYENIETENHNTIPHRALYRGLEELYSGWRMTNEVVEGGAGAIKKHYQSLSNKFGYTVIPQFSDLYILGMSFLQQKKVELALDIFKLNADNNPKNWAVYSCLGQAYQMNNNIDLAISNYEKAVELNPNFTRGKEILSKLKERK